MTKPVTDASGWNELWSTNFRNYVHGTPRTGVFVLRLFPHAQSYLEIGAGSARDSFYLSQNFKKATASDFSDEVVAKWKEVYGSDFRGEQIDAFNIDATDSAFDISFHNGLYVLFDDDQIKKLIVEQFRITRQAMVIIVH